MSNDKYDPNAPETEEDGLIAGKLRMFKVFQHYKALTGREHPMLQNLKEKEQASDLAMDEETNVSE